MARSRMMEAISRIDRAECDVLLHVLSLAHRGDPRALFEAGIALQAFYEGASAYRRDFHERNRRMIAWCLVSEYLDSLIPKPGFSPCDSGPFASCSAFGGTP